MKHAVGIPRELAGLLPPPVTKVDKFFMDMKKEQMPTPTAITTSDTRHKKEHNAANLLSCSSPLTTLPSVVNLVQFTKGVKEAEKAIESSYLDIALDAEDMLYLKRTYAELVKEKEEESAAQTLTATRGEE